MHCEKCKGNFEEGEKIHVGEGFLLYCGACYRSIYRNKIYTGKQKSNAKVTREQYEIAIENKIAPRTVRDRIQKGYSVEKAITYPTPKRRMEDVIKNK